MLTEREDVDIAHNDHFVVIFLKDGIPNHVWKIATASV